MVPCRVLCELEQRLGKPCYEHFSMVAGTSIGGILACLISSGKAATECLKFFTEDGPFIFGNRHPLGWRGIIRPRYGSANIERVLQTRLGLAPFHRPDALPHCIVTAYDLETDEDVIFKSWEPNHFLLWQIARATSAAQTYFPAFAVRDTLNNVDRVLWDGGVVANNPSGIAVASAATIWPGEELTMLSVGCGSSRHGGNGAKMVNAGLFAAGARTLSVLFETNDEVPDKIMRIVLPKYVRIQPEGHNLPMDDASPQGIRNLEDVAYTCIEENEDRMARYLSFVPAALSSVEVKTVASRIDAK
jgi:hypothetical protein